MKHLFSRMQQEKPISSSQKKATTFSKKRLLPHLITTERDPLERLYDAKTRYCAAKNYRYAEQPQPLVSPRQTAAISRGHLSPLASLIHLTSLLYRKNHFFSPEKKSLVRSLQKQQEAKLSWPSLHKTFSGSLSLQAMQATILRQHLDVESICKIAQKALFRKCGFLIHTLLKQTF